MVEAVKMTSGYMDITNSPRSPRYEADLVDSLLTDLRESKDRRFPKKQSSLFTSNPSRYRIGRSHDRGFRQMRRDRQIQLERFGDLASRQLKIHEGHRRLTQAKQASCAVFMYTSLSVVACPERA
jgi:hypothetical protein